jgi:hypothetical protein
LRKGFRLQLSVLKEIIHAKDAIAFALLIRSVWFIANSEILRLSIISHPERRFRKRSELNLSKCRPGVSRMKNFGFLAGLGLDHSAFRRLL